MHVSSTAVVAENLEWQGLAPNGCWGAHLMLNLPAGS